MELEPDEKVFPCPHSVHHCHDMFVSGGVGEQDHEFIDEVITMF
jgi:hypothetical protein